MRHEQTIGLRHQVARCGQELEANMSALQREPQEKIGHVSQRDDGAGANFVGLDRCRGGRVSLPQLRLEGSRR